MSNPDQGADTAPAGRLFVMFWRTHDLWLVGPFATHAEAAAYGRGYQAAGVDDPRWDVLLLVPSPDQHRVVRVVTP